MQQTRPYDKDAGPELKTVIELDLGCRDTPDAIGHRWLSHRRGGSMAGSHGASRRRFVAERMIAVKCG